MLVTLFPSKSHHVHMTMIFQSLNTCMFSLWLLPITTMVPKHMKENFYGYLWFNLLWKFYHFHKNVWTHSQNTISYEVTPLPQKDNDMCTRLRLLRLKQYKFLQMFTNSIPITSESESAISSQTFYITYDTLFNSIMCEHILTHLDEFH